MKHRYYHRIGRKSRSAAESAAGFVSLSAAGFAPWSAAVSILMALLLLGGCAAAKDAIKTPNSSFASDPAASAPAGSDPETSDPTESSAGSDAAQSSASASQESAAAEVTDGSRAETQSSAAELQSSFSNAAQSDSSQPQAESSSSQPSAPVRNGTYGSFTATDINGVAVDGSILGERYTMVNVWATYCGYCIREMPALEQLSAEYASDGIAVIGLLANATYGDFSIIESKLADAKAIIAKNGVTYTNIIANAALNASALGVSAFPTAVILDSQGNVAAAYVGMRSADAWRKILDALPA